MTPDATQLDCMLGPPPRETAEGRTWLRLIREYGLAATFKKAHRLAPAIRARRAKGREQGRVA